MKFTTRRAREKLMAKMNTMKSHEKEIKTYRVLAVSFLCCVFAFDCLYNVIALDFFLLSSKAEYTIRRFLAFNRSYMKYILSQDFNEKKLWKIVFFYPFIQKR